MEDILLSVSSPPEMDYEIFMDWINGKSVDDSIERSIRRNDGNCWGLEFPSHRMKVMAIDHQNMTRLEVLNQFRTFSVLEHYLAFPALLREQTLCTIVPDQQRPLIEMYWSLDDSFVKELLHKRLPKSRKDLEDASEQASLTLRQVTRQFDNIKRVYSCLEETTEKKSLSFISNNFLLGCRLAKRYLSICFLLFSKFNLRRIQGKITSAG
jgi:hypothetical protein